MRNQSVNLYIYNINFSSLKHTIDYGHRSFPKKE